MNYSSYIDNVTSERWSLNIQQAYLFDWLYRLPSWASEAVIDGNRYFFASRNKAIQELPLLTDKPDTMYRYYKQLEEIGVIGLQKVNGKDYICLTEKGKEWGRRDGGIRDSEKNPSKSGNFSESDPEIFPTYKNTNTDKSIRDNTESSFEDSSINPIVESDSPTQEESSTEPQKKTRALAKEKEPLDPCYHEFVRIWIEAYPDFMFGKVEGRKIKDLIPKLRWHQRINKKPETPEAVCHLWQYIVNYLKKGESQYSNKSLKYIDSTIDQIIYEIRNGRQQRETPYQKQQRELAELRKRPVQDF